MPHPYEHHSHPWAALGSVLGVLMAALLIWLAWRGGQEAGQTLKVTLRDAALGLPGVPRLPEGPKLPHPPIPFPK